MNKPRIFIDGQEGTTGLRIRQMLAQRQDLELMLIPTAERKNEKKRAEFLNRADLAILCLPDEAAAEAIALVENPATRIIDTSTPRRVQGDWIYGLPEISAQQRDAIRTATRVANVGCYPVGFILAVRPLVEAGLLDPAAPLTINAVSGYSGGGRKMIESYRQAASAQSGETALPLGLYSLGERHKHIAEMYRYSLLQHPPLFTPSVAHAHCGMLVSTPIPSAHLTGPAPPPGQVYQIWRDYYHDAPFVQPQDPEATHLLRDSKSLDLEGCNHTNRLELYVFGDKRGLVLVGRLDNLGKGASGNAVQCLNLMLGCDETRGLQA
ncbi:MAG: N-acetyl-gamma-glutamyl-phosphate reductase [Candidatus Latescibacteria bacterium]|nr:N-acetyl-gamma-glutamyl-phosphate reductase [Candidatus Latescibacterota bacterium]